MVKRFRCLVAVLSLFAIAVLLFRTVALDAIGAPYGAHNSPDVELAQAQDSPHCALLADCETVSISNVGLDLGQTGIVLVLAGLVFSVAVRNVRFLSSWTALVPNRPPLSALS